MQAGRLAGWQAGSLPGCPAALAAWPPRLAAQLPGKLVLHGACLLQNSEAATLDKGFSGCRPLQALQRSGAHVGDLRGWTVDA